jgi:polysaccharide deacetylase family protein (PEP-CTERM system associated)
MEVSAASVVTPELDPVGRWKPPASPTQARVILSFDVEEHDRIEAASGIAISESLKAHHRDRLVTPTEWILDALEARDLRATFFIVGQVARRHPRLVRAIHHAGHEVASHSWDHQSVLRMTPTSFRDDLRKSRDALEQVTGQPVVGFRAPTFSVVRRTSWALDVLAEEGMVYDSSIYPVRHDRYGEPRAPRMPFLARGTRETILEIPPATLDVFGLKLPIGGGGYFRLFPLSLTERGIRQAERELIPPVVMLYFHPWEFDPGQRRLPLKRLSRFRTYVGIGRSRDRLETLMSRYTSCRAVDVARELAPLRPQLLRFNLADATTDSHTPCS